MPPKNKTKETSLDLVGQAEADSIEMPDFA